MPPKSLRAKLLAPYRLVSPLLSIIGLVSLFFIEQQARTSKIQTPAPTTQATHTIPLEIQLKSVCLTSAVYSYDIIRPYVPGLRDWDSRSEPFENYKARIRRHLTFTPEELIAYLRERPKTCETLLQHSYDKRYSETTFIEEWKDGHYRVGWVSTKVTPAVTQVRVFPNFAEATADYVLFSWGLPRLTKEQSAWYKMDY